jgi:hypothetical protein
MFVDEILKCTWLEMSPTRTIYYYWERERERERERARERERDRHPVSSDKKVWSQSISVN